MVLSILESGAVNTIVEDSTRAKNAGIERLTKSLKNTLGNKKSYAFLKIINFFDKSLKTPKSKS